MGKNFIYNINSKEIYTNDINQRLFNISEKRMENSAYEIFFGNFNTIQPVENRAFPLITSNALFCSIPSYNYPVPEALIKCCTAIRMSGLMINIIDKNEFNLSQNNCFSEEFFNLCINSLYITDILENINDIDLLVIYLKQISIILKSSGLIYNSDGIAKVEKPLPTYSQLFHRLFTSFWNELRWEDIFPSMPDAANHLNKNRNTLINLMMKREEIFCIHDIANDFFRVTNFGEQDDIYLISSIDFYFFTWMSFFGIIDYLDYDDEDNHVRIKLTDSGRRFLQYFRSN